MNKLLLILTVTILFFGSNASAAGPAGDIVSLKCSHAISAALEEIKKQKITLNVTEEDGVAICITPNDEEILVRFQSPEMSAKDSKYLFTINAKNYEIIDTHFGR